MLDVELQVLHQHPVLRALQHTTIHRGCCVLDWLLQFCHQSSNLRILQSRIPTSFPKHTQGKCLIIQPLAHSIPLHPPHYMYHKIIPHRSLMRVKPFFNINYYLFNFSPITDPKILIIQIQTTTTTTTTTTHHLSNPFNA